MAWLAANDEHCGISILSLGEIRKGIAKIECKTGKSQTRLANWLDRLAAEKQHDILPLDADTISLWGTITGRSEAKGAPLPVIDSLIAATAMVHKLRVATRNTDDFERCGAKTVNPWK
jgi:predicted nucleic acid-binding protein